MSSDGWTAKTGSASPLEQSLLGVAKILCMHFLACSFQPRSTSLVQSGCSFSAVHREQLPQTGLC